MDIQEYFKVMVEKGYSELFLTVARPPIFRVDGNFQMNDDAAFTPQNLEELAKSCMSAEQWDEFQHKREMNFALSLSQVGRFRVNVLRQRGSIGMSVRRVKIDIPPLQSLSLPPILEKLSMLKRGLVLIVGGRGAGKSTTLASMIDLRNSSEDGHIITVEDPIEFVHRHKKSIVIQREVGIDTNSFQDALENALRESPDVILIGEIRNTQTMESAMTLADAGRLCMGTLYSTNTRQCFDRLLHFFPPDRHPEMFVQLSMHLRAIVAQRLVPTVSGCQVPAVEVLLDTPRVKELIKRGEIDSIKEAVEQDVQLGCQTFDQALFQLLQAGKLSLAEALANADSPNNLRLKIKLAGLLPEEATDKSQPAPEPEREPETAARADTPVFRLRRG